MVTAVRVACDYCSFKSELHVRQVTISMCSDDTKRTTYLFNCPRCLRGNNKSVSRDIFAELKEAGCPLTYWKIPREIMEHPQNAPIINHDDLLDFHEIMETCFEEWFTALKDSQTED